MPTTVLRRLAVSLAASLAAAWVPLAAAPPRGPLNDARQLLVVVTDGWDAVRGTAQRFERATAGGSWRTVGPRFPIVVGRNGLGWGRGVAAGDAADGPSKHEGDGKAPAGVFPLASAFGQSKEHPAGWRIPYRFLGDDVECVDDVRSAQYNELVTKGGVPAADWTSSEKMWLEPLYKWGVVVDYNRPQPLAGAGSCIFLHTWKEAGHGTAGCTAMAEPNLTATIAWLDPARKPRLVQLPRAQYERLKSAWQLPALAE